MMNPNDAVYYFNFPAMAQLLGLMVQRPTASFSRAMVRVMVFLLVQLAVTLRALR